MTSRSFAARSARTFVAFLAASVPTIVSAQVAPPGNPLPGPTLSANAAPVGPQEPVFGPGDVAPDAGPLHPPINLIPSMPMPTPEEGPWNRPIRGTVTVYDITTGQSREAPLIEPSGLEGGYHDGYSGVDANVEMPEMDRNFGTMAPASNLTSFPASANCKVIMRFQNVNGIDYWFGCSGTLLDSGVVLTAAHCVYARDPNGIEIFDWAREIYVYPGWDGMGPAGGWLEETVIQNFGWARASELIAGTDYVEDGNFDQDVGAIRISRELGRSVGMLTGWYGGAWGQSCSTIQSRTYSNYSFPGEDCGSPGLHDSRTMMFWSGSFDSCPGNQLQLDTSAGCFTAVWGGMSGSSAYYVNGSSRIAHAVASNSNRSTTGRYAKIWEDMANQITNLITSNRGTVFDLTAMRFRLTGGTVIQATTQTSPAQFVASNPTNANPASGLYTCRVYLSNNIYVGESDTLLGTFAYSADYGPMQSVIVNIPAMTIPNVTPGTYWLGVVLDSAVDTNDDNNDTALWDCQQITVTAAPPPAPANNACAGAITHTIGTSNDGTTTHSTTEGDTTCGFASARDVWYRVTPPITGTIQFDTCGSLFDTVLSVHSACPGTTANQIACNDDAQSAGNCPGTAQSVISPFLIGGTTYYIRVAGYNGASGNFTLNSRYVVPANDDCSSATPHAIGTTSVGSLAGASNDGQASCGSSGTSADVWFSVTPTQTCTLRLDTCGSSFDTVLSVHTSCPGTTSNQIGCNDDSSTGGTCFGSLQSAVDLGVVAGQTYLVRVSGFSGAIGGFNLRSAMVAAPNDGCAGAINFAPGTSTTGVTTGSTPGGAATCGTSNASPDLWYRMIPTCTGTLRLDTCGSTFDTVLSVHTACPGTTGNQLACSDDSGQAGPCPGSLQSFIDINVYANATYYIRVSGYNGNTGYFRLNSAYLMNSGADNCENAPTIGDGTIFYSNCGATTDGPEENHCSFAGGDALISRDLWFDYVAPSSGTVSVDTCSSAAPTHNTRLAVYAGGCPGGLPNSAIACNDDACGQLSSLTFSAVAGQHYLIRVGGTGTSRGAGTLTIASNQPGPCDGDVNCDFALDGFDVEVQEKAVGGDMTDYCQPNPDFNGDFALDGFDVEAVEVVVGGGPCP